MMKAFGLQLDGLSEAAQMNVADLEDDFEELYDLYGENLKMHPMVRIPLRTCMMIYMVHLTNQMARKAPIPNIDDIMRQNPDIARSLAAAAMQNQTQQMRAQPSQPQQQQANPLAGLMSFMQQNVPPPPPPNMAPRQPQETKPVRIGVRKTPQVAPSPQPVVNAAPEMRAPPSIEELLKDIKQNAPPAPKKANNKPGSTGKNSVVIKL
jgi:outer membrane biosynthesis protein TonB